MPDLKIVIKGAGEIASGIAHRLYTANMTNLCMLEIDNPLCVRRLVSFCEALFQPRAEVEGVEGVWVQNLAGLAEAWNRKQIGVFVDPEWRIIASLKPDVVIDAILAKRNTGTRKDEAPVVIGVGPGFSAPDMVHAVIESNRGHCLGRAIYSGAAEPNTGEPAAKAGYSRERVIRAPHAGTVRKVKSIGDDVKSGDIVLYVDNTPVRAAIDGSILGLIREIPVAENEKLGDIDPMSNSSYCRTLSDKARAIGGGVLEAILHLLNIKEIR